jgi:hypothetical protein
MVFLQMRLMPPRNGHPAAVLLPSLSIVIGVIPDPIRLRPPDGHIPEAIPREA